MIHTSYTVGLTTAQYKALQYNTANVQGFLDGIISSNTSSMISEIKSKYVDYKVDREEAITAIGSTAIIQAAYTENVIGIKT